MEKVQSINTGKYEVLLVQIPEDLSSYYINQFGLTGKSNTHGQGMMRDIPNICFDNSQAYTIVGKLCDLTNDQVAELVLPGAPYDHEKGPIYKNYNGTDILITSWQSLYSCMEAAGIYTTGSNEKSVGNIDPKCILILKRHL